MWDGLRAAVIPFKMAACPAWALCTVVQIVMVSFHLDHSDIACIDFFFFFTSLKLLQTQRRFFRSSFIKDLRSWCCWLLGEMMKMSSYNRTSLRDDDPLENYLKRCCCKIMFWLLVTLESWCQCHFGQLLMVKNQKSGRKIRGKCCKCV